MTRVMAVGVFDLLHAGHLHYLEQAKELGDHLTVVIAHDDTVRMRKHEPVTSMDLRCRMVAGLKPVDHAIVGNPPSVPMYAILPLVKPDIIAIGYDQQHAEAAIRTGLDERGFVDIKVVRVTGLTEDLDGTRKIVEKILSLQWAQKRLAEIEDGEEGAE